MTMNTTTTNGAAVASSLAAILSATPPEAANAGRRTTYDGRYYGPFAINGEARYYPSVTNILNDVKVGYGFGRWGEEQAAMLGLEGARLDMVLRMEDGTLVHSAIERYLNGETLQWDDFPGKRNDDFTWKAINRFVQWFEATRPIVHATEMTVYSHDFQYAGTCDAIIELDGELFVLDFKSSKQVYDSHELQVAAYARAVTEMFGEKLGRPVGGAILALSTRHKAGYHFKVIEDLNRKLEVFLHRNTCYRDEHPTLDPKHDVLPERLVPSHSISPLLRSTDEVLS